MLVTGGAGFIGSNLVRVLSEKNYEIIVVDDLSMGEIKNLEGINHVKFYEKSVCDYDFMHSLLLNGNFEYIYMLAAVASVADSIERPWNTHQVNAEAIINTLEFIRRHDIKVKRILFSSSAAVYGNGSELPKKETSDIRPLSPYAIDKFSAERYMVDFGKLYDLPTVCVRFFNVYGPNQNPKSPYSGVLSILTACLINGKSFKLFGNGKQTRDFIYVGDVIRALLIIMDKGKKSTVYNVANGVEISLNKIISECQAISGRKLNINKFPARRGDIVRSFANIDRLTKIGFEPKWTLQEGLQEYWQSIRSV